MLGEMNPGVSEVLAIGKRSDVTIEPQGFADGDLDARQFYDIVGKGLTDCIMGRQDAASAIRSVADELRSKGIIN